MTRAPANANPDQEEIEGLEREPSIEEPSAYPLDDVMVRSETRTVADVVKRIESGRYIMDPDFQRAFVWETAKQSKLIESCVMRIPLPVFYVAEMQDARIAVVDGLQRLSTFRRFFDNQLKLALDKDHPLNGLTKDRLPIHLQERVEDTQITLYILDKSAPEVARLDIFERVNGGVPLTRQQMRNAIYNGAATRWLGAMAETPEFKRATGGTLNAATMRDREAINRFAAFRLLGWQAYDNGDMDGFLAKALGRMNAMAGPELDALGRAFVASMAFNTTLFARHAFRKSLRERTEWAARSVINIALFDVASVLYSRPNQIDDTDYELSATALSELVYDQDFDNSITYSTNSTTQVKRRFQMAETALATWLA